MAPETGEKWHWRGNHVDIYKTEWKRNHYEEHCSIIHSTPYSSSLQQLLDFDKLLN